MVTCVFSSLNLTYNKPLRKSIQAHCPVTLQSSAQAQQLGLGTELQYIYSTDRIASILWSIKKCVVILYLKEKISSTSVSQ